MKAARTIEGLSNFFLPFLATPIYWYQNRNKFHGTMYGWAAFGAIFMGLVGAGFAWLLATKPIAPFASLLTGGLPGILLLIATSTIFSWLGRGIGFRYGCTDLYPPPIIQPNGRLFYVFSLRDEAARETALSFAFFGGAAHEDYFDLCPELYHFLKFKYKGDERVYSHHAEYWQTRFGYQRGSMPTLQRHNVMSDKSEIEIGLRRIQLETPENIALVYKNRHKLSDIPDFFYNLMGFLHRVPSDKQHYLQEIIQTEHPESINQALKIADHDCTMVSYPQNADSGYYAIIQRSWVPKVAKRFLKAFLSTGEDAAAVAQCLHQLLIDSEYTVQTYENYFDRIVANQAYAYDLSRIFESLKAMGLLSQDEAGHENREYFFTHAELAPEIADQIVAISEELQQKIRNNNATPRVTLEQVINEAYERRRVEVEKIIVTETPIIKAVAHGVLIGLIGALPETAAKPQDEKHLPSNENESIIPPPQNPAPGYIPERSSPIAAPKITNPKERKPDAKLVTASGLDISKPASGSR